jgi:thioesterase domain-containing protein
VDDIPLLSIPERRQLMASEPAPAAAEGPAPEAVREEIRQRRQQLAGRRKQLSPERQALLRKWVGGGPEEARPAVAPKPEPPRVAPLVAIQPRSGDSSRAPLFLVHPGNGNVNNYLDLVKHLGPDQPVYALQAPGLTSGDVLQGMDSFADCYLQAIRELQPHGPYRLGGWCMGGAIAHAIASRLHAAGEEIEILLLIDSYAPPEGQAGPADEVSLLATLANDFGGASAMRMKVPVDVLRSLPEAERLPWIVDRARSAGILPEGFALEQARRDWEVFRAIVRAIEGYARPEPLPVHAVLYRAAVQPSNAQDPRPALGWDRWIASPPEGRLEIIPVDGDHYAVVREPLVGIVAREMAGRLAAEAVSAG